MLTNSFEKAKEIKGHGSYPKSKSRSCVEEVKPIKCSKGKAKDTIKEELARFNIREDFIYPDMDSVANEINEIIDRKEEDQ